MNDERKSEAPERVRCEVCLKEIPRSEARSGEATEYVAYFCGLDCYEKWQAGQHEAVEQKD